MGIRIVHCEVRVGTVLTDATSAVLSDPSGTFGVKRNDTGEAVVAAGTAMTRVSTGIYEYTFTEPAEGLAYTAWVEIDYQGAVYHRKYDLEAIPESSASDGMSVSFFGLQETLARYLFGIRSGLSAAQLDDVNDCIKDGLHSVYLAHQWSFTRPVKTIETVADQYAYDLPLGFDSVQGPFTYAAGSGECYPPVKVVSEKELRRRRAVYDDSGRPVLAALVTAQFDPTVGSKRQVEFYPTPDDAYSLSAVMRLRPIMLDVNNPYPLGGETLAPVITEACLAAAERLLDETEGVHGTRFRELLALAIRSDQEASSPDTLGADRGGDASDGESCRCGITIYMNGEPL